MDFSNTLFGGRGAVLVALALGLAACADDSVEPVANIAQLIDQAEAANDAGDVRGLWRTTAPVTVGETTAWVDLIWIMGEATGWHVVTVYADEAQTIPIVRWDIVRDYTLGGPAAISADARELDWSDRGSWLVSFLDSPELLAVLGVDDCGLVSGQRTDTAPANCGTPFFPVRTCVMEDFAELRDDVLTFGDPLAVDRCAERVNEYEAWSFERVPFTPDIDAILADRPELSASVLP
ncbi:MAG: hypothetical protein AAF938_07930 [Myxococcota bacterium]